jgi:RNA polymerase sigma-70 factor (ECF subfamily)
VATWCRQAGLSGDDDIADVLQEVFRSVFSGIQGFQHDSASHTFRGWLRIITRNKLVDYFRKQHKSPHGAGGTEHQNRCLQVAAQLLHEVDVESDRTEMNLVVQRGLELVRAEFEERTWNAFWRVTVDGRSPEDVARELNTSRAAVYKAKSRVLLRLREVLGAEDD